jgi:hypothetical protein
MLTSYYDSKLRLVDVLLKKAFYNSASDVCHVGKRKQAVREKRSKEERPPPLPLSGSIVEGILFAVKSNSCMINGLNFSEVNTVLSSSNKEECAVPWLMRLVSGLPPQKLGFDPGSVHVGFVVDKVALEQVFPRVLRFSPVSFIPTVLHYLEKLKN